MSRRHHHRHQYIGPAYGAGIGEMTKMKMQDPAAGQFHTTFHSGFGYMRAISDGRHLIRLDWDQDRFAVPDNPDDVSRETCRQLAAYLAGSRTLFDLPLRPEETSEAGRFWLTAMA